MEFIEQELEETSTVAARVLKNCGFEE